MDLTPHNESPVVREVVLELLRAGPPHNQLLSPLTPYLALCSSHSAEVIHVPFEHWELLRRLRALEHEEGDRTGAIQEMAKQMAEIMGKVAGLGTELTSNGSSAAAFTHLRLVISASELALLPWELATAARGFPGEGTPLVLQTVSPISLTREVRRPPGLPHPWPTETRILFAAAAPEGMDVPRDAHLLALRKAIEPWVKRYPDDDADAREREIGRHLEILPNASLEDIREACAGQRYTHVHVLAHGIAIGGEDRRRYGLALHDPSDPDVRDVVSGERLASALIGQPQASDGPPRHPTVVTVASCQGGDVGAVAFPGGSLAHDLHRAGIPLVVASQFPLTFAGSVLMVEVLYGRLLWGEDPRPVLRDLRARLHALAPDCHDWASIVAYVILPPDLPRQLGEYRYQRALEAIRLSMERADQELRPYDPDGPAGGQGTTPSDERLDEALNRFELALSRLPELQAEAFCHRGAQLKRWAQLLGQRWPDSGKPDPRYNESWRLEAAREQYRRGFKHRLGQEWKDVHWAGTQFLSLSTVLGVPVSGTDWNVAVAACERELEAPCADRRAWAYADLIELYLLAATEAVQLDRTVTATDRPEDEIPAFVVGLHRESRDCTFVLEATKRQIKRFTEWWGLPSFSERLRADGGHRGDPARHEQLAASARSVLELLEDPHLATEKAKCIECRETDAGHEPDGRPAEDRRPKIAPKKGRRPTKR